MCIRDRAKDEQIIKKIKSPLPQKISRILKCNNPRCITNDEKYLEDVFELVDEDKGSYKCQSVSYTHLDVYKRQVCGNDIIEGEKGFGCTNWKNGCKYTIWKNDKFIESMGKKVTKEMVKLLLKNGKVGFRNLKSKKGTLFSAYLRYEKDEKTGYYNWKMEFIN